MRRSGVSALASGALLLVGCFYGFAGGGLPDHVDTVAVLPFENDTPVSALSRELQDVLRPTVESRLGLRSAAEPRADAIVRGRILRYEADIPAGYSADARQSSSARRRLEMVVDVEIVDQSSGKTLWSRKGLTVFGEYNERAESEGRRQAIEKIAREVVEGAQSQW